MKVLVTGGSGFIGSYVASELRERGHEPILFDHHDHQVTEYPVILGEVRDRTQVTDAVAHADGVIHLAAVLGTQETILNPYPAAEVNIFGTLNVLEACTQYGLPLVYAGVGNHWMRDHGTGAYTITKTCAEDFTRTYRKYRDTTVAVVRPVNAYGPGQSIAAPFGPSKVRKVMPSFICRALSSMPIEIYGDGEQISDMVYVEDVARTFVKALGHNGETALECGPSESCSVNDLAQMVATACSEITGNDPVDVVHLPMRPGEVPGATVKADPSTLEAIGMNGDESFITLLAGVRKCVMWFHREEGKAWSRPA